MSKRPIYEVSVHGYLYSYLFYMGIDYKPKRGIGGGCQEVTLGDIQSCGEG